MTAIVILLILPVFPPAQDEDGSALDESIAEIIELILRISAIDGEDSESTEDEALVVDVISVLRSDKYGEALSGWEKIVTGSRETLTSEQANEVMWYILAGGFGDSIRDLRYLADKVRFYIDAGKAAEEYLVDLEKYSIEAGEGNITITTKDFKTNYTFGQESAGLSAIRSLGAAQIRAEIQRIEALKKRFAELAGKTAMILEHSMRRRRSLIDRIVTLKKEMEAISSRELENIEDDADAQEG
jgi:hypothetical protein